MRYPALAYTVFTTVSQAQPGDAPQEMVVEVVFEPYRLTPDANGLRAERNSIDKRFTFKKTISALEVLSSRAGAVDHEAMWRDLAIKDAWFSFAQDQAKKTIDAFHRGDARRRQA